MIVNSYRQNYLTPEMDHPRSSYYHYQQPYQQLQTVHEHQPANNHYNQFITTSTKSDNNKNYAAQPNEFEFEGFTLSDSEYLFQFNSLFMLHLNFIKYFRQTTILCELFK